MDSRSFKVFSLLLWAAECACRPTFHNLNQSFESWCHQQGFDRALAEFEQRELIRMEKSSSGDPVLRLTGRGRVAALGGRDPVKRWSRPWDGTWRLLMFDIPRHEAARRQALIRWLRTNHFGLLQNSVWLTPDALDPVTAELEQFAADPENLITIEGRPCAGESDASIVTSAWPFGEINGRYRRYQEFLSAARDRMGKLKISQPLEEWAREEAHAWQQATGLDPLLPRALWPEDYEGERAHSARMDLLRNVAA